MMGLTFIVATVIVFGAIACFAEFVREKISSARVQQIINRTGAVIFHGISRQFGVFRLISVRQKTSCLSIKSR